MANQIFEALMDKLLADNNRASEPADLTAPLRFAWKEQFDQHKLKYIIDHLEELKTKIVSVGHDFKADNEKWKQLGKQLSTYLDASNNGVIEVKYHQTASNFGRMFANRSLSLQNITRAVRHTIAGDLYWDIDVENAHPTILEFICKQRGIETPALSLYNERRDEVLDKMMEASKLGRGDVKKLFLSIMNGGNADYDRLASPPPFITMFKTECNRIWGSLITLDPNRFEECKAERIRSGKNYNHDGSFANKMLCDFENKILGVIVNHLQSLGLITDTCALCFDGVMIPRRPEFEPEAHLAGCQAAVKSALGIDIKLKVKPMTEGLELPADLGEYKEPRLEYFADHNKFAGKEVTTEKLDSWVQSSLVYITGGGNGSMYTKNVRTDPESREPVVYFEAATVPGLMSTLDININLLNPEYDPAAAKEAATLEAAGKRVPKELAAKATKYDPDVRTLDKYVKKLKADRKMVVYNGIDFYPYLQRRHPEGLGIDDTFNVFTGFPLDGVAFKGAQTFEQSRLYAHLRDEMFPGDIGELNHFLDFVADMVQQPAKLRPVAHVFFTEQGCGKGMIVEWIKSLLGREHVVTFNSTSAYFQKFNADRMNKILNVLEELSERGECFSQHNQLKADMTAPTIRIEWKGGAISHMRNFARYIFNSNNENTLNVEHDDRRLTMHRGANRMANKREYFEPIWAEVHSREFALMCFNYMAERKYDEANVMRAYDTKYKRDQKESNLSNVMKFIIHCIEKRWDGVMYEKNRVGSTELSQQYAAWCGANRLKVFSHPTFLAELRKIGIETPTTLTLFGQKQKAFVIDEGVVRKALATYLRQDDFKFDMEPLENAEGLEVLDYKRKQMAEEQRKLDEQALKEKLRMAELQIAALRQQLGLAKE